MEVLYRLWTRSFDTMHNPLYSTTQMPASTDASLRPDPVFSLFLRTREAQAIERLVAHVRSLSEVDRRSWLQDNATLFYDTFEMFMESSSEALSNIALDQDEALDLSARLVSSLRQTSLELSSMLDDRPLGEYRA